MTQEELAEVLGKSVRHIQDLESKKKSGVESNWEKIRHTKFSSQDLVHYLDSKKHLISKIKEGFDQAPPQSQTIGREVFVKWWQNL